MRRNYLILFAVAIIALLVSASGGFCYENMYHNTESSPKLNYDSLFNAATPLADSEDGREIVELCFKRYGGREKLEELESFLVSYKMKTLHSTDTSVVSKYWNAGRQYKIIRMDSKKSVGRILNKEKCWYQTLDTTMEMNSGRYKAELFSYLTLSMPLAMETERFDDIRYGMRENEMLHFIYMKKNDSLMIIIGIDPHQFHIVSSEGVIFQEEQKFVFINIFSDYKDVDGYLFSHRLKNISMGLEVGNSIVTAIEVNKEYNSKEFTPGQLPKPSRLY